MTEGASAPRTPDFLRMIAPGSARLPHAPDLSSGVVAADRMTVSCYLPGFRILCILSSR
jgi:hypothetical protein